MINNTMLCFDKANCQCFSDFTVKFVDVESKEQKLFSGHEAPVLGVALHPDEQLIVSQTNCHMLMTE